MMKRRYLLAPAAVVAAVLLPGCHADPVKVCDALPHPGYNRGDLTQEILV